MNITIGGTPLDKAKQLGSRMVEVSEEFRNNYSHLTTLMVENLSLAEATSYSDEISRAISNILDITDPLRKQAYDALKILAFGGSTRALRELNEGYGEIIKLLEKLNNKRTLISEHIRNIEIVNNRNIFERFYYFMRKLFTGMD